jgi:hypothetical protein
MKWMPRIFSLLILVFYLALWLFNDDVRSRPTLQVILLGLLTIVLLLAWRWEKIAGRLAVVGGIIFFLIVIIGAISANDIPPIAALLGGALLTLPFVLTGCLFILAGREAERSQGSGAGHNTAASVQNPG